MKKNITKLVIMLSLFTTITTSAYSQIVLSYQDEGKKFFYAKSNPGAIFYPNDQNILVNNQYRLTFQSDKNLVLYNGSTPIWASGAKPTAARLEFWATGFVGMFQTTYVVWDAQVGNAGPNKIWVLQDDGNFVGYNNYVATAFQVTVTGEPFAATGTAGGRKNSKHNLR